MRAHTASISNPLLPRLPNCPTPCSPTAGPPSRPPAPAPAALQGWRLQVRAWPRLTDVGAWRGAPPLVAGGFYTQQQVGGRVKRPASPGTRVVQPG